jgi:hypothetical protein
MDEVRQFNGHTEHLDASAEPLGARVPLRLEPVHLTAE